MDFVIEKSRMVDNIKAVASGYNITAVVNFSNGKVTSVNGVVTEDMLPGGPNDVHFDAVRVDAGLNVNYHNIPQDRRVIIDIIADLVDSIKARYEAL